MAVPIFQHPEDAAGALLDYIIQNPDNLSEDFRQETINSLKPGQSTSFAVSEFAERVFARAGDLPKGAIKMGAAMANVASFHRINNFADDDGARGRGIAAALHRRYGTPAMPGSRWPTKDEDPAPKDVYKTTAQEPTSPHPTTPPGQAPDGSGDGTDA